MRRNVINLELMDQPPAERASDNRWPFWPRVFRVDYGHAEAAHLQGADPRRYCVLSKRFISDDAGAVTVRAQPSVSPLTLFRVKPFPDTTSHFALGGGGTP